MSKTMLRYLLPKLMCNELPEVHCFGGQLDIFCLTCQLDEKYFALLCIYYLEKSYFYLYPCNNQQHKANKILSGSL